MERERERQQSNVLKAKQHLAFNQSGLNEPTTKEDLRWPQEQLVAYNLLSKTWLFLHLNPPPSPLSPSPPQSLSRSYFHSHFCQTSAQTLKSQTFLARFRSQIADPSDRMSFLVKDPTLKLFGKTIPLNQSSLIPHPPPFSHLSASPNSSHLQVPLSATSYPKENTADEDEDEDDDDDDRETSRREVSPRLQTLEPTTSSGVSESSRTSSVGRETSALQPSTNGEQGEAEGKTLKKPDKLLPCPRCNSTKTKFCYYNNYNVNQPRHFCKNCQRYWTAGGTMRSVPVGAGRRKNKNSSVLPYSQMIVSMSAAHRNLETAYVSNGSVFKPQDYMQSCFPEPSGDDRSSRSSITGSNSLEKESKTSNQEHMVKTLEPFPPQIPTLSHLQWGPQFQPPFYSSSGFPVSCHPIPFWGCTLPSSWVLPSSSTNSAVLMPKSLRIDDLNDAEKSCINGGKLFNGFQSKRDEQSQVQTFPLLQANPAALSRSIKFHERS